jgi:ribosomal protein S18 acetylase RimI-like enzyme
MNSLGDLSGCDWAVIAPDGCVAAFCIVWPDVVSRIGQIEPVGTHPDFQRKGLGKAVVSAGMRHLQCLGMRSVRIRALSDNPAAFRLYESVGFRTVNKLWLHQKRYKRILEFRPPPPWYNGAIHLGIGGWFC